MLRINHQRGLGFDLCDVVFTNDIPDVKIAVQKAGCSPAGRAAAAYEIQKLMQPDDNRTPEQVAAGMPAPQPSAWASIVSTVGPQLFVDCTCKGMPTNAPLPTAPTPTWVWAVGGVAVLGVLAILMKQKAATPGA